MSLQYGYDRYIDDIECVTILVLVEMSLQWLYQYTFFVVGISHNPCFSRNVFAIVAVLDKSEGSDLSQSLF